MTEIPSNVSEWKEKIVSYFHAVSDDTKKQVATLTDSENPVNWE